MTTIVWAGNTILDAETPVRRNFAVAVENNRIIETGAKDDLMARFEKAEVVGGENFLLTAALVNSHDHGRILGTAALGIPDDMLEIWLPSARTQPTIDPYTTALYSGLRLLKAGVGSVVHQHRPRDWSKLYEESSATIRGYRDAGIRVVFCILYADRSQLTYDEPSGFVASLPPEAQKFVGPFLASPPYPLDEYTGLVSDLVSDFSDIESHTTHISVCPAGGEWCSDELLTTMVNFSQQRKIRVQMHLLETKFQKISSLRRFGKSMEKHLDEIGVLGPWLTLAHVVWPEIEDLPLLAERKVGIAHNPSSNLRLRSGISPVERMIEARIPLGIGLDGIALDDDQDYLRELRLAWTLSNKPGASAVRIPAQEIWRMGTSGGAQISFGPEVKLGKLARGYLADLTLIDFDAVKGVWFSPEVDALDVLLRHGTRQHVRYVMVNGKWVIKDGQSPRIDEGELIGTIQKQLDAQFENARQNQLSGAIQQITPYLRKYYARIEGHTQ